VKFSKDIVDAVRKMPTITEMSSTLNRHLFDGEHTGGRSVNYDPNDTVKWDPKVTFCTWTSDKKIISCMTRSADTDSLESGMSLVHPRNLSVGDEND